jgi:hypothetical protein
MAPAVTVSRPLVLAAILAAGCATAPPPASSVASDAPQGTGYRRCSAADPDRSAWFCVIGQIVYNVFAATQTDPSVGPR